MTGATRLPNNFLGKPVYKKARAFLQRPAAEALLWKEYPILDIAFSEIK